MAIRIAGGEGTWEWAHVSVPCLPCHPPLPAPVTHSTFSTFRTPAPFPVVLWQCTQLHLLRVLQVAISRARDSLVFC